MNYVVERCPLTAAWLVLDAPICRGGRQLAAFGSSDDSRAEALAWVYRKQRGEPWGISIVEPIVAMQIAEDKRRGRKS